MIAAPVTVSLSKSPIGVNEVWLAEARAHGALLVDARHPLIHRAWAMAFLGGILFAPRVIGVRS